MDSEIPRFEPHPLLRDGHSQTIAGFWWPDSGAMPASERREVRLPDGDRLVLRDSSPEGWGVGDPIAVLVHGLAGGAGSPYVVRLAVLLVAKGVRVLRMNLRGAGEGFGLARGTYHAGRSEDLREVVEEFAREAPGSPIGLVGFSLGGNLALKLAAEAAESPVSGLNCVVAANPPLDLSACCRNLRRVRRKIYDRNFVKALRSQILRHHAHFPDLGPGGLAEVRTVYDFDERYTAPRNGFRDAEDYYARSSAGPMLPRIRVPGLVIHAEDDPFIPVETFRSLAFPPGLALELIPSGGHLGYISRSRWGGNRRWLDTRLAVWLADWWGSRLRNPRRRAACP